MTVSELVNYLNKQLETDGDCEVRILPIDIGESAKIVEITYIVEDGYLALIGHH